MFNMCTSDKDSGTVSDIVKMINADVHDYGKLRIPGGTNDEGI